MRWWPAEAAPRIAVVDIGSNAIRLAIFEIVDGRGHEIYNERARPQLGKDLGPGGRLSPERVQDALGDLARFAFLARRLKAGRIHAVATAAVRAAPSFDRHAFITEASGVLGTPVRVLSGPEEARLSAEGVIADMPDAAGLVADIGGLSLEIAPVGFGGVLDEGKSFDLGPLAVQPQRDQLGDEAVRAHVDALLGSDLLTPWSEFDLDTLYGVGGAWRNIAACHMHRMTGAMVPMQGFAIPLAAVRETLTLIYGDPDAAKALMTKSDVSRRRQATLPAAALVLDHFIGRAGCARVVISTSGVRKGVLVEALRTRPPRSSRTALHRRRPRRRRDPG